MSESSFYRLYPGRTIDICGPKVCRTEPGSKPRYWLIVKTRWIRVPKFVWDHVSTTTVHSGVGYPPRGLVTFSSAGDPARWDA